MRAKKLHRVLAASLLLCMGVACSPLNICYSNMECEGDERCFKGEKESSAAEGICLAPSCEPVCVVSAGEACFWDLQGTTGWEAHCVVVMP
ncbi:MAG: hypothetical protein FWG75_06080 [Cystobacterineae bacterium]|nr:hypothetical protein [Cystobacterineae bacterium]